MFGARTHTSQGNSDSPRGKKVREKKGNVGDSLFLSRAFSAVFRIRPDYFLAAGGTEWVRKPRGGKLGGVGYCQKQFGEGEKGRGSEIVDSVYQMLNVSARLKEEAQRGAERGGNVFSHSRREEKKRSSPPASTNRKSIMVQRTCSLKWGGGGWLGFLSEENPT